MSKDEQQSLMITEKEFLTKASSLVEAAQQITVASQEDFEVAADFGKGVSRFIKNVEAFFAPLKKAAKAAHAALCDREKEILKVPLEADAIVKRTANAWKAEQKRKDEEALRIERERLRVDTRSLAGRSFTQANPTRQSTTGR